jgi:IS1 family transposase
LVEGNSLRGTSRITGIHRKAIVRLMMNVGAKCQQFMEANLRNIDARHLEIDEQWTWVGKKQGRITPAEHASGVVGDQYLFVALDQKSKLIACHQIGKRTEDVTRSFLAKLAVRIVLPEDVNVHHSEKPQLSTDGFNVYPNAIADILGSYVQHGVIIKNYADPNVGRYAPPQLADCDRRRMQYVDDLMTICTSHVERFNCTTRMFVKRFCRLTLAFSKKLANLEAAVALYIAYYNWCWRSRENDGALHRGKFRPTPAMQAGLCDRLWKIDDLYDAVMAA